MYSLQKCIVKSTCILTFITIITASAFGQDSNYPSKPITIIVPYAVGGTADSLARLMARHLSSQLGQTVLIENKPGAGTAIGAKSVASAKPDGYTLLWGGVTTQVMNPGINRVPFNSLTDFTAIAPVGSLPLVVISNLNLPVKNMAELSALAKSNNKPLSYATAGAGTSNHLAAELFAVTVGASLLHVPYKGSAPAMTDLLGGQIDIMWDLQATAISQIKAGKVRPLAITSIKRSATLPDIPTMAELGMSNNTVSVWPGVFGPAGMSKVIVDKLNTSIVTLVKSPQVIEQLQNLGVDPETSTPTEYDSFVRSETVKWTAVIKAAKLEVK
jgi:tripartite-type tricarboxylate transporter receptor subunit TctC